MRLGPYTQLKFSAATQQQIYVYINNVLIKTNVKILNVKMCSCDLRLDPFIKLVKKNINLNIN